MDQELRGMSEQPWTRNPEGGCFLKEVVE